MKKVILLCVLATTLSLVGCVLGQEVTTAPVKIVPVTTVPATSESEKPALVKANEDDNFVYYDGTVTVQGEYKETSPNNINGGTLCFYANEATGSLIPREGLAWFCFENQEEAKTIFEIKDSEIFGDNKVECLKGLATVEISNYKGNKKEAAVHDTAKLEKVITKELFSTDCKLTD